MSFELYSEEGFLGPAGSVEGWSDLMDALRLSDAPAIRDFAAKGYSGEPSVLASSLSLLLQTPSLDKDIRDTLSNLVRLLGKAKEIALVTG